VSDEIYRHNPEWLRGGRSAFSGWWTSFSNKGRLLELGCGAGRDIPFYLELGFCVTGVDYSKTALARAKNSLGDIREGKVVLVELELTEFLMKVEPQSYDAVCSNLVYGGFTLNELKRVFRLVYRALKQGGIHAYCVRSLTDPHYLAGEKLGRYTRLYKHGAGGFLETYFTPKLCKSLSQGLFETIKVVEVRDLIWVVERKDAKCEVY